MQRSQSQQKSLAARAALSRRQRHRSVVSAAGRGCPASPFSSPGLPQTEAAGGGCTDLWYPAATWGSVYWHLLANSLLSSSGPYALSAPELQKCPVVPGALLVLGGYRSAQVWGSNLGCLSSPPQTSCSFHPCQQ